MATHKDIGEWYDSSRLSLFQLCPRRYYYRHELELVPNENNSVDLAFGTAIHKALEAFYLGEGFTSKPCPHRYAGDEDCPYHRPDGKTSNITHLFLSSFPKHLEGKFKTQEAGLKLLSHYLDKYEEKEPFSIIGVEQPFIYTISCNICGGKENENPLCEDHHVFHLSGRIDLLVDYNDGSGRWPLDHKTPGRVGGVQESSYRFDLQISTYIAAVSSPTQPIRGAIINNLHPAAKVTETNLFRYLTTRSDWDIKEWEKDVRQTVAEIKLSQKTGHFRKHAFACHAYNRECEYHSLCSSPPEGRANVIERLYHREIWEPF